MLNFILFFFALLLSGFIFRLLWRVLISPVNGYFVTRNTPTGVVQVAWLLLQMYIVLSWAVSCVCITHSFIAKPGVALWWGYYILASFGCSAPLHDTTSGSTNTIAWFSTVAFLGFSFFPSLTQPWHWLLRII